MKENPNKPKSSLKLTTIAGEAANIGKIVSSEIKTGITVAVEKNKNLGYQRKLKKYNPLFPEQYNNPGFALPNIIIIVDDAVRRGIDVCEGAMGWLSSDTGSEILYLYDEFIDFSGIKFVPAATCDSVFYVDSFDRWRFIRTDCIFKKAHDEQLAELKNVAYCIGAKRCTIEIVEAKAEEKSKKGVLKLSGNYDKKRGGESAEQNEKTSASDSFSGRIVSEFEGNSAPEYPQLKWFADEDTIINLINMCCSGKRTVKSESMTIEGASFATMSQNAAYSIDCAIAKMAGAKGSTSMSSQVKKEHHRKLTFIVEF